MEGKKGGNDSSRRAGGGRSAVVDSPLRDIFPIFSLLLLPTYIYVHAIDGCMYINMTREDGLLDHPKFPTAYATPLDLSIDWLIDGLSSHT